MYILLKNTLSILIVILVYLLPATAQKFFTLEQVTPGSPQFIQDFYPASMQGLQWSADRLLWIDGDKLMAKRTGGKTFTLLTYAQLEQMIPSRKQINYPRSFFPYCTAVKESNELFLVGKDSLYLIDPDKQKVTTKVAYQDMDKKKASILAIDRKAQSVVMQNDQGELFVVPFKESRKPGHYKVFARNEGDSIIYGQAVHQREFGIEEGIFFSPNATKIAFYRMDQSMVKPYPIVNYSPKKAEVKPLRYPMAGDPSHQVTIGVYDIITGNTIYLNTGGDPEHYLTNIAFTPDGENILVAEINRKQNHLQMNLYDATSGKRIRTLFEEKEDCYLDPSIAPTFLPKKKDLFLWTSRHNGYYHLYLYNLTGDLQRQVTNGDWEVLDIKGFSPNGEEVLYDATKTSPLERRLYKSSLFQERNPIELTHEPGVHYTKYSPEADAFVDSYSSPTIPRKIELIKVKENTTKNEVLLEAKDPTENYTMPHIEVGTITADDGQTPLYYRLIKPINFDPNKKYPTIVYVYGGPHAQLITNNWLNGAGGWDIYMAQQGYIIFTLDNRGSAHRGRAFEQAIWKQVGSIEMQDQMKGITFLKKHTWVDKDRIGVYGWSFGGFMTTNLMLSYPETFKVGVAGGPVMDWSRYEIMYGERYNGSPQENPEGYKANNLIRRAENLKGRLLLIHGVVDNVVLWQHAIQFVEATIKANTYPDCMYYPTHEHNVLGIDRVHLNYTITRYFKDHL